MFLGDSIGSLNLVHAHYDAFISNIVLKDSKREVDIYSIKVDSSIWLSIMLHFLKECHYL